MMDYQNSRSFPNLWIYLPIFLLVIIIGYFAYFGHEVFTAVKQNKEERKEFNLQMSNLAMEKIKGKKWEEISRLPSDNNFEVRVISPDTVYLIYQNTDGRQFAFRLYPEGEEPRISSNLIRDLKTSVK